MEALGEFISDVGPDILFNLAAAILFFTFAKIIGARSLFATAFALTPLVMSFALGNPALRGIAMSFMQ